MNIMDGTEFNPVSYVVAAQINEPSDEDYEEIIQAASGFITASGPTPIGKNGRPRMLVLSAWIAHEGRNLNGDAFVKEELKSIVSNGLFAPPYAGMIDDDHDFTARGYWYKASFAFDDLAQKWGIFANGAVWAWRYSELSDRLLNEMQHRGKIDVSMSTIAGHAEISLSYPGFKGQRTKILHNPVFFTTSLLSVPPGDPYARGIAIENSDPTDVKDVAMSESKNNLVINEGHQRSTDDQAVPAPVGGSMNLDTKEALLESTVAAVVPSEEVSPCNDMIPEASQVPSDDELDVEATKNLELSERKTKAVGDEHLTADKFAYVGDPQHTETWKLPIHDANHVRNALARFNQTEGIPESEKAKVKAKILKAAKKFGIDVTAEAVTAAGAPTTRTEVGDDVNDGQVEVVAPDVTTTVLTVPVNTDSDKVVEENTNSVVTDVTAVVPDVDKTKDLTDRKVSGALGVRMLRFSKSFWNSSNDVLAFIVNEALGYGYHKDEAGKLVSDVRESNGAYEVDALAAEHFTGSMVEHCLASFGGDCAIIAVVGEVVSLPQANFLPMGQRVQTSFVKQVASRSEQLIQEVTTYKARLAQTEQLLNATLTEKQKLAIELEIAKTELVARATQAKLEARLAEVPELVKAKLQNTPRWDAIVHTMRSASDDEWDFIRTSFKLASISSKSFTEISQEEGKLPVGGGSTTNDKPLKEFLR